MTTLLPIPGAPGYRIDLDTQQAYSLKRGCIRPMKPRTKYKCVSLYVEGKVVGSTIYRMMYCAQHGIDINRLPSDVCFSMENGVVVPMTREQVVEKSNRARQKAKPKMERLQRNMELIVKFYAGDVKPLLDELRKIEGIVTWYFIDTRGIARQRAELISANAVNRYLDRLKAGNPTVYILQSVKRYAVGENARLRREMQLDFIENMQPIKI